MADRNRRFTLAAIALPLLLIAMSGLACAHDFVVTTLSGAGALSPLCSLSDAVTAHNSHSIVGGCGQGSSNDRIFFAVTGKILIKASLEVMSGTLSINGPLFGCSGPGPCGITIDGGNTVQIIHADLNTSVSLTALTLAHGRGVTSAVNTGGGAIFTFGNNLTINDCLFVNNQAVGFTSSFGGEGGALYAGVSGTVVIVNSTFANNTAVHGSSIPSEGGAISAEGDNLKITNVTISGNSADTGGGIDFGIGSLRLKNSILSNNTGGNCGGTPTDLGANIADDDSCLFSVSPSMNNTNPLLEPLANNGGPTDTFAIETFPLVSPALSLVSLAKCTDQSSPTPKPLGIDQRLFARPDPFLPVGCDSGAYEAGSQPPYEVNSERVQIARASAPNSDKVNIGMTFTSNGDDSCDLGPFGDEDALNFGVGVALVEGTCASLPDSGLFLNLFPFVVSTVNKQQYGTLFQASPSPLIQQSTETVSARLVALPTPNGACGEWTLNLQVAGLNTNLLGLGGGNPFAILITDFNDAEGCFDVTNAIVGNQIPTPSHAVTSGSRR